MSNKPCIILCEDDMNLAFIVQDNLEAEGFKVKHFADGQQAFKEIGGMHYDLCILDIGLPSINGFELADKIRKMNEHVPILFLTARSMKEDKLQAFRTGADDYITKPFSIEELIFRCKVFLKRSGHLKNPAKAEYSIGQYQLNAAKQMLLGPSFQKKLTNRELELLLLLVSHINEVVSREEILLKIWGDNDYFSGRSMDVFISKLRKYLHLDSNLEIINFHGNGFMLKLNA
jgi:DNA-binding response OmpR family regulator